MWQEQITCLTPLLVYPLGQFFMQDSTSYPTPHAHLFPETTIWVGVSCGDVLVYSCNASCICGDKVLSGCDVLVPCRLWFGRGCFECFICFNLQFTHVLYLHFLWGGAIGCVSNRVYISEEVAVAHNYLVVPINLYTVLSVT